jgi:hypothetical protein
MRRWIAALGLMLLWLAPAPAPAPAQEAWPDDPLADFAEVLPRLPPPVRERLQQRAAAWADWSPAQRQAFAERAAAWDALPREQRIARRVRYARWQALDAQQQRRLRSTAARFAALPEARQRALREEFAALDGSLRHGWLLGPELGADYAGLQPLLAQVPAAEHGRLLAVLQAMTARQRDDLIVLVQRTPPQERAELRRELVSTAAANRDEWLWSRLER